MWAGSVRTQRTGPAQGKVGKGLGLGRYRLFTLQSVRNAEELECLPGVFFS